MKNIYFDNAATTKIDKEVYTAMIPFFLNKYGNPSEYHSLGRESKSYIEKSRKIIASFLGAKENEIIFVGSATESINLAIKGLIEGIRINSDFKPNIITSTIEHKAVLETCNHIKDLGWATVTHVGVDKYGMVDLIKLKELINKNTVLISIMYVNNEVGTIEDIKKIGTLIKDLNKKRKNKIYFHTDATQALMCQNCNVKNLGVDLLSFSGHKINAPKGIGVLFKKDTVTISRQIDGGSQESGLRSGTENVGHIVAIGKAVDLINKKIKQNNKIKLLSDKLIKGILTIPDTVLTGHPAKRSPYITSFLIKGIEGESLVLKLSQKGVYASSGSACTTSDLTPSHVLSVMGYSKEDSHGSVRFSLGYKSNKKEVDYLLKILPKIINDLRKMSPLTT